MSASSWYSQSVEDGQHPSYLQTTLHPAAEVADESYESCTDNLTVMSRNIMSSDTSWITELSSFEEFSHYYENYSQQDAANSMISSEAERTKNTTVLLKGMRRDATRRQRSDRNDTKEDSAVKVNNTRNRIKRGEESTICDDKVAARTREGFVYLRAKRGQATNSHSLAERVRRQKISEKMKHLQSLVPNCNKVHGKIPMLDNIIDYIHSLQYQVKSLMEDLAFVDPTFRANYLPAVESTATIQPEDSSYATSASSEFNSRITTEYQFYSTHPSPWLALLEESEYTI